MEIRLILKSQSFQCGLGVHIAEGNRAYTMKILNLDIVIGVLQNQGQNGWILVSIDRIK